MKNTKKIAILALVLMTAIIPVMAQTNKPNTQNPCEQMMKGNMSMMNQSRRMMGNVGTSGMKSGGIAASGNIINSEFGIGNERGWFDLPFLNFL